MDRTLKFALASLVFNIAFATYHLVIGLVTRSWWLLTLGSYYLVLSVVRFVVLHLKSKGRSTSRPGRTWPPEGGRGRSTSRPGRTWPPEGGRGRSTSPPFRAWCPSGQLCGRCVLRARVGLAGPSRQTDPLSDVCIFFSDVSSWLLEVCV